MRNASTLAHQGKTLNNATNHREHWEVEDLEFVEQTMDDPVVEVALALGRTQYAIWTARHRVAEFGVAEAFARSVRPTRVVSAWDRGFTDIEALFA